MTDQEVKDIIAQYLSENTIRISKMNNAISVNTGDLIPIVQEGENKNTKVENISTGDIRGWNLLNILSTFQAWDVSIFQGIINTNVDLTGLISKGMKIRFRQNNITKYAFITAITSSQITLFMGTDYILDNAIISDIYFSNIKAPYGFPLNPAKWTIQLIDTVARSITNNLVNVWQNLTDLPEFYVGIGDWKVSYNIGLSGNASVSTVEVYSTLSTTNNGATESDMTAFVYFTFIGTTVTTVSPIIPTSREKIMTFNTKTRLYMNLRARLTQVNLRIVGDHMPSAIKAVCAYL